MSSQTQLGKSFEKEATSLLHDRPAVSSIDCRQSRRSKLQTRGFPISVAPGAQSGLAASALQGLLAAPKAQGWLSPRFRAGKASSKASPVGAAQKNKRELNATFKRLPAR